MNLSLTLHMSRNAQMPRQFMFSIEDERSGVLFLELELNEEQFANLLSNRPTQGVPGQLRGLDLLGTSAENKTVLVKYQAPSGVYEKKDLMPHMDKALAKHEVDGWVGDRDDLMNHHRIRAGGLHAVTFRRHVK